MFSPCKVDGAFWSQFHVILSYLGNPTDLADLKDKDPDSYAAVIEPFVRFISVTEEELFQKGHIKKQALEN